MSVLIGFFSLALIASASEDTCSSLIGTCEYYACIDASRISCGPRGYTLGYGVKYCEILSALEFHPAHTNTGVQVFTTDGNLWRDNVRSCLQREMDDYFQRGENISCSSLQEFAFNSHPRCYTQSPSFCELSPESVLKVGLAIQPHDFLAAESQKQVKETAKICAQHITERLKSEKGFLVRLTLQRYRLIWNTLALDPIDLDDLLASFNNQELGL